jgi:hypothetical protein
MIAVQEGCKWHEDGMLRCHSSEEIRPVDVIEGARSVVGASC